MSGPGLQRERTGLAWRRTALNLGVGAIVSFRLLPRVLGLWSIAVGIAGLLLSAVTWILAGRRMRRAHAALLTSSSRLPGGGLPLFLTLVVTSAATLALLYTALE